MKYLITGGTGTLGIELSKQLLSINSTERVVVYSRDEAKHAKSQEILGYDDRLRSFIGDICDTDRLSYAMKYTDIVIHAAAMKRIEVCEYEPLESVRINVLGTKSVAEACSKQHCLAAIFISSDKACNPICAYGAQKYTGEHLWIGMNNMGSTRFNVMRYGNVVGSRGSVFHLWKRQVDAGLPITLTNEFSTRFFWTVENAAYFVISKTYLSLTMDRGLVFVPRMQSCSMYRAAERIANGKVCINVVGFRCPEKLHEDIISDSESKNTYLQDDGSFIIYPTQYDWSKPTIAPIGEKIYLKRSISSKDFLQGI